MIARCRAKSWIVQLSQDDTDRNNNATVRLPGQQRGTKGHVVVYPQRPSDLLDVLPPTVEESCSPICIVFIGSSKPSKAWLKKNAQPLIVRRERVRRALLWLKEHNHLYRHIFIDHHALDAYPSNDILPAHIEALNSDAEEVLTSQYDPTSRNRAQSDIHMVILTFNQLRAAAIKHIKTRKGGFLTIAHGHEPANEFFNPELFPMIYPTLYPCGRRIVA
ncbi:hypothetical protein BDN70DRAFT_907135 [Pholiota conissans]|uniref:DUF6570 domain-containing protein n=1 Tax=Pholiota conissans TaxID=109636 RepID=A0A9P5YZ09_9AGAR|nr:hypothetical protein BDN70DRAFT_907135 [Pholiota conissans]